MTNTAKNMGKLQVTTPSEREIAMTRVFDAPRSLVFDAWTKPELLKRWLGVRGGWTFAVCEVDLRVGGSYRFVWRGPTGAEMGMGGVYREIVRPERLVATEKFDEPWYEGDALDTTTFVERGGKTTATTTVRYASQEVRDAVLKTPMLTGVAESYDKMAEVLASRVGQGVQ
ncbi:MAG TPA: SRPBCC family protein [Gemmatimonadales bacterium]|nr:SRPBCC family protein [Gemmatimonadales bacterium]